LAHGSERRPQRRPGGYREPSSLADIVPAIPRWLRRWLDAAGPIMLYTLFLAALVSSPRQDRRAPQGYRRLPRALRLEAAAGYSESAAIAAGTRSQPSEASTQRPSPPRPGRVRTESGQRREHQNESAHGQQDRRHERVGMQEEPYPRQDGEWPGGRRQSADGERAEQVQDVWRAHPDDPVVVDVPLPRRGVQRGPAPHAPLIPGSRAAPGPWLPAPPEPGAGLRRGGGCSRLALRT